MYYLIKYTFLHIKVDSKSQLAASWEKTVISRNKIFFFFQSCRYYYFYTFIKQCNFFQETFMWSDGLDALLQWKKCLWIPLCVCVCVCVCVLAAQSRLILCDPLDFTLPGSSVHRNLQVRILKWFISSFFSLNICIG